MKTDINWKSPFDFWRLPCVTSKRAFYARVLVEYTNKSCEVIGITRLSQAGGIGIDGCLADFAFGEYKESNYRRIALIDYKYT